MTQRQSFAILPNGKIKGGTASYQVDTETGVIEYSAQVRAGFWFFEKTLKFDGTFTVDPETLRSENYTQIGDGDQVGILDMVVSGIIRPGLVRVGLVVLNKPMRGVALVDIESEFIKPVSLRAEATVSSFDIILELAEG